MYVDYAESGCGPYRELLFIPGAFPFSDGREVCELRFATLRFAPPLPVQGALLPARLRTLAQSFRGRTYYYAPSASGRVRPGRLLSWRFDTGLFPDLAAVPVLAALKVESFRMTFPVAAVTG
jgi:hypothetical protein